MWVREREVRKATKGPRGELAEGARGFEWASRKGKAVSEGQGGNGSLSSEDLNLSDFACNIYEVLGEVI